MKIATLVSLLALLALPALAQAPANAAGGIELALGYSYMRSNAPPGICNCFTMNGATESLALDLSRRFALVGEVNAGASGNVANSGLGLDFSQYLAGVRYRLPHLGGTAPFVEALAGFAHDGGSGYQGGHFSGIGPSTAFGAQLGGGFDVPLSHGVSLRPAELDWIRSDLPNHANNRQNTFRYSAGVVFRLDTIFR